MNQTDRTAVCGRLRFFAAYAGFLWLSACASAPPAPPPEWDASPSAIRRVFPDGEYIAQRGWGATREEAETRAAAELGRFISSQISANRGYAIQTSGNDETVNTSDEAYVRTRINLFGIRYAADAWYSRNAKEWRTVAYIERAEAWAVYEPDFRRQAAAFDGLYAAAEAETDPFKKALRFIAAGNFARSAEFENANLFGQILFPERMNAGFAAVRERIAAIPQKTDEARRNAAVYIDCPVDFESLLANAFASRFSALGFPVTKARNAAAAVCAVTVDEGMQKRDIGIFYFPSLRAAVSGSSGALFAFSAGGERASAVTPDVAKRRANQSLADAVTRTFSVESAALSP